MSNTSSDHRLQSWTTNLADALGVFAAVWGVALGVLIVGLPVALVVALALRLGRMVFSGL